MRRIALSEVAPLQRRAVQVEHDQEYTQIGVRSFGRGLFVKPPVNGESLGTKRVFWIEPGDLVISNVFGWEGAVAVAGSAHAGTIGSHRFMTLKPRDGVNSRFLQQYLLTREGLSQLRAASPGSAGRNRTLSVRALQQLRVPMPDTDCQEQLVAQLGAYEERLERLEGALANATPVRLAGVLPSIVAETLSSVGLPKTDASQLYQVVNDIVHPGDPLGDATAFIGLQHVEPHTGRRLGADPLGGETGRKFRFRSGDVLYGYLRPYLNKVWVADRSGLCSVEQFVLRPRPGVDSTALGMTLRSNFVLAPAVVKTNNLQLPRLGIRDLDVMQVPDIRLADDYLVDKLQRLTSDVGHLLDLRQRQLHVRGQVLHAARETLFSGLAEAL
ncbi:MAG: hypothetical protein JWO18_257 [Microbacteriaceae bacterium]|nr:hypothetical protein [Microbacteriaceae bacterium]